MVILAGQSLPPDRYLHQNNIVHRDLKLENFIFTSKDSSTKALKMIDFGLSRQYDKQHGERMTRTMGTATYFAPELIQNDYTEKSDLWSLGVCAFMCLTGEVPFPCEESPDYNDEMAKIIVEESKNEKRMHADLKEVLVKTHHLSQGCCDFICALMTSDPKARLSARDALQHPWMTKKMANDTSAGAGRMSTVERTSMVSNLKNFKRKSTLQRTAMMALATGLSTDELQKLNAAFLEIDTNNDGLIEFSEFVHMLKQQGMTDQDEMKVQFDALDQDNTGYIKYSEFIAAAALEQQYSRADQIEGAFHKLDLDGSGTIGLEELKQLLPPDITDVEMQAILAKADTDGSGEIDIAEFTELMKLESLGSSRAVSTEAETTLMPHAEVAESAEVSHVKKSDPGRNASVSAAYANNQKSVVRVAMV